MKKKIMLGVATLALAAVPMASTFADSADTVSLTISTTCTITGGTTHSESGGLNALVSISGSTFTIKCNGAKGYTATLKSATAMQNGTVSSYTIPYYSSTAPAAGGGVWGAYIGSGSSPVAVGGTIKETSAADTSASGSTVTMNYKVGTTSTQAAGTYTGTATYQVTAK